MSRPTTIRVRCELHPEREAKLYCQACSMPICCPCATTKHCYSGVHDCRDIEEQVLDRRQKLGNVANSLSDRLCRLDISVQQLQDAIDTTHGETGNVEAAIRRRHQQLKQRIDADLERLLDHLRCTADEQLETINAAIQQRQTAMSVVDSLRQMVVHRASNGSDEDVLKDDVEGEVRQRLESVEDGPVTVLTVQFTVDDRWPELIDDDSNTVGYISTHAIDAIPDDDLQPSTNSTSSDPPSLLQQLLLSAERCQWSCTRCTYINRDTDAECRMCSAAPWKDEGQDSIRSDCCDEVFCELERDEENIEDDESEWKCSNCMTSNEPSNRTCKTCWSTGRPPSLRVVTSLPLIGLGPWRQYSSDDDKNEDKQSVEINNKSADCSQSKMPSTTKQFLCRVFDSFKRRRPGSSCGESISSSRQSSVDNSSERRWSFNSYYSLSDAC